MDYQFYGQPGSSPDSRRSQGMETASLILGILAVTLFCCIYPPFICGSLAIVLGLLSRGGESTPGSRARIGIILGSISLAFLTLLTVGSIIYLSIYYGSFQNMIAELYTQYQDYMNVLPQ